MELKKSPEYICESCNKHTIHRLKTLNKGNKHETNVCYDCYNKYGKTLLWGEKVPKTNCEELFVYHLGRHGCNRKALRWTDSDKPIDGTTVISSANHCHLDGTPVLDGEEITCDSCGEPLYGIERSWVMTHDEWDINDIHDSMTKYKTMLESVEELEEKVGIDPSATVTDDKTKPSWLENPRVGDYAFSIDWIEEGERPGWILVNQNLGGQAQSRYTYYFKGIDSGKKKAGIEPMDTKIEIAPNEFPKNPKDGDTFYTKGWASREQRPKGWVFDHAGYSKVDTEGNVYSVNKFIFKHPKKNNFPVVDDPSFYQAPSFPEDPCYADVFHTNYHHMPDQIPFGWKLYAHDSGDTIQWHYLYTLDSEKGTIMKIKKIVRTAMMAAFIKCTVDLCIIANPAVMWVSQKMDWSDGTEYWFKLLVTWTLLFIATAAATGLCILFHKLWAAASKWVFGE